MVQLTPGLPISGLVFENLTKLLEVHKLFAGQEIVCFIKLEDLLLGTVDLDSVI